MPNRAVVQALQNPTREECLKRICAAEGAVTPRDLAQGLDLPESQIGYHVRVLAEAGLIALDREAPIRGSIMRFYKPAAMSPR